MIFLPCGIFPCWFSFLHRSARACLAIALTGSVTSMTSQSSTVEVPGTGPVMRETDVDLLACKVNQQAIVTLQ